MVSNITKLFLNLVIALVLAILLVLTTKTYYDAISLVRKANYLSIENLITCVESALLMISYLILCFITGVIIGLIIAELLDKIF